jgi:hypothetical protein
MIRPSLPWLLCQFTDFPEQSLCVEPYLLAVQASVISLENDELLAGNVESSALDLLDVGGILEGSNDLGHFLRRDLVRAHYQSMFFLLLVQSADVRDPTLSRIAFSNGW